MNTQSIEDPPAIPTGIALCVSARVDSKSVGISSRNMTYTMKSSTGTLVRSEFHCSDLLGSKYGSIE